MVQKILSWLTSFLGSYGSKIVSVLLYVGIFLGGCYVTHLYYDHKILEMENATIKAINDIKTETIKELEQREKETAQIITARDNEKDKLNSDIAKLQSIIDGMRNNSSSKGSVSTTSTNSAKPTNESSGECKRLLLESAELLREGVQLSGNISIDKDAVVKLATQKEQKK